MNKLYKHLSLTCITLFLLLCTTRAQEQKETPYTIKIAGRQFLPAANSREFIDNILPKGTGTAQLIVQFYAMPTAAERDAIGAAGIVLKDYLCTNTFIATATLPVKQSAATALNIVRSFTTMRPEWKIAALLLEQPATAKVAAAVKWEETTTDADIQSLCSQAGATITDKKMWKLHIAVVSIPVNKLKTLAASAAVKYISPASQYIDLNYASRNANKVNYGGTTGSLGGYGLYGDSVTVGIGDNVSGKFHIDLLDRITNFNPSPYTNHGQHTNGTIGGAGIVDIKGEGMASHVQLLDHLYDLVWIQTEGMRQNYNMTLTNNSYAALIANCSYAGQYDIYSEAVDQISTQFSDVLHVFASGNDGYGNCAPYPAGFATTVGSYQASKNAVVVGNTDKEYQQNPTTSRGPVKDGRMKPEITAIGSGVYSCTKNDSYLGASGTSMACPEVTGTLAALSQRYKQLHNNQNPPSDILKTLLLNGTTDIGWPGPDYTYGFGRMNFYRSLLMMENNQYLIGNITQGAEQTFQVAIPAGTSRAKIMLYWHDTSANPAAAASLVNDLDLTVTEPSATIHNPFIPFSATPAMANNPGAEGVDHLNNIEQVTINNPAAGTYTVKVKGYSLPSLTRRFILAYDFEPNQMSISFPLAGATWNANDSMYVYWDAPDDSHTFSLDFSINNGASWSSVNAGIPANVKVYNFLTPNINSEQCRFRLTRNGVQTVSPAFVINQRSVVSIDSTQLCPGYFAIKWTPVPNATAYQVLRKKGFYLQPADTVTSLTYTFSGLSPDSTCYATVVPFINGVQGMRSLAVFRRPNSGSCAGTISDGDLMMEKIIKPTSGRLYTSTALKAADTIQLSIRNLDNTAISSYTVHYKINNGSWTTQAFTTPIPALSSAIVSIPGQNFSALGVYRLIATVQNTATTDNVHRNDTLSKTVKQLDNAPVNADLGTTETFDNAKTGEIIKDTIGLATGDRWDFTRSTDTGRLRLTISPEIDITNNGAASMDVHLYSPDNKNYLVGTYNLANYNKATDEIRLEFDYRLHGKPKFLDGNNVWIRGSDQAGWIKVFTFDTTKNQGQTVNSGSISITNALLQSTQNFSASTQVRFGQRDSSVIAANDYGNGTTLDNIQIYTVKNDVQLLGIVSPGAANCNLGTTESITIKLYNGYNQPQSNVLLYYRADGGAISTATLPAIAAKDTVIFTFPQTANLSAKGIHSIDAWLVATGDTYRNNDSILQYKLYNLPLITTFPYLETFEQNDGYWYAAGRNSSWQWGAPASIKINKAAGGKNAWKTNLKGNYNTGEASFLYSPCFATAALSNPLLSLSLALNIENCVGGICDGAWLEYSTNDSTWTKLLNNGFNWYGPDTVWNDADFTRWHVASVPLPRVAKMRLRFVFTSDGGANFEGIAIDDIHIFDKVRSIYSTPSALSEALGVEKTFSGNTYTDFLQDGRWLGQINPLNKTLTTSLIYQHRTLGILSNYYAMQYIFPTFFSLENSAGTDSFRTRLYINDMDYVLMQQDTSCYYCEKPESVYAMGMSYIPNGGIASFRDRNTLQWVPYDSGYYAELTWKDNPFIAIFSNGGATGNISSFTPVITLNALKKAGENSVNIEWYSLYDTAIARYTLERKYRDETISYMLPDDFDTIYSTTAKGQGLGMYQFTDPNVVVPDASNPLTYRVKYVLKNGTVHYSAVKTVDWYEEGELISIYPNPVSQNTFFIKWGSGTNSLDITITDVAGRKVYKDSFPGGGTNVSQIQLPPVAKGIYLLRMAIGDKNYNHKIVVQ